MAAPFPELTEYQNLIFQGFLDVGPTLPGFDGETPVSFTEAQSFTDCAPEFTEPWETRLLVSMSRAYLDEKRAGAAALARAPMERG